MPRRQIPPSTKMAARQEAKRLANLRLELNRATRMAFLKGEAQGIAIELGLAFRSARKQRTRDTAFGISKLIEQFKKNGDLTSAERKNAFILYKKAFE